MLINTILLTSPSQTNTYCLDTRSFGIIEKPCCNCDFTVAYSCAKTKTGTNQYFNVVYVILRAWFLPVTQRHGMVIGHKEGGMGDLWTFRSVRLLSWGLLPMETSILRSLIFWNYQKLSEFAEFSKFQIFSEQLPFSSILFKANEYFGCGW